MTDINKLREHLFTTLEGLQDKENPMDIERAKAICETGQVIVNAAKAEIDFAKVNGAVISNFFEKPALPKPAQPTNQIDQKPAFDDIPTIGSSRASETSAKPDNSIRTISSGQVIQQGNTTIHRMK